MKIFQASMEPEVLMRYSELFPDRRVNVLLSYAISRDNNWFTTKARDIVGGLILDSGTYTFNYSKQKENLGDLLERYRAYLQEFGSSYDYYINFDDDFSKNGFKVNFDNQEYLEAYGLIPVPVVHDVKGDEVDIYLDKGCPIIAIGSSEGSGREVLKPIVDKIHRAEREVHIMGSAKVDLLMNLPIEYCDSSSWAQRGAYGEVAIWDKASNILNKTLKFNERKILTHPDRDLLEDYLWEYFKMNIQDIQGSHNHFNKKIVNLHYSLELEAAITGKWLQ